MGPRKDHRQVSISLPTALGDRFHRTKLKLFFVYVCSLMIKFVAKNFRVAATEVKGNDILQYLTTLPVAATEAA